MLTVRVLTLNNQALPRPITARFNEHGGTIGRADTNTLILPDPHRHVSRVQAQIVFEDGVYRISNAGTSNPIMLNGAVVGTGEGMTIGDGDELVIGGYTMSIQSDTGHEPRPAPILPTAMFSPSSPTPQPAGQRLGGRSPLPPHTPAFAPPPAPPPRAPIAGNRLPDDFDPFADSFAAPSASPGGGSIGSDFNPMSAATPSADPFDFIDKEAKRPAPGQPASAPPLAMPDSPFDLVRPKADQGSSIDQMFGLDGSGHNAGDPLADFEAGALPDAGEGSSVDPLALFGSAADESAQNGAGQIQPAKKPAADSGRGSGSGSPSDAGSRAAAARSGRREPYLASESDHVPELRAAFEPPRIIPKPSSQGQGAAPVRPQPTPAPRPAPRASPSPGAAPPPRAPAYVPGQPAPQPAPRPAPVARPVSPATPARPPQPPARARPDANAAYPDASGARLWAAFCEGAGVNLPGPQQLTPEMMRTIGTLMRHSVHGTLQLMAIRRTAKSELKATVTEIRAVGNNPLKFSPNADAALAALLQPPVRGFLAGPAAVRDAMDDLLSHNIATMVGMRAALAGLLQRFDPETLQKRLGDKTMLDALMPTNRKAKLWDLYVQHAGAIKDEAEEDFHAIFGKAFLEAYEEQLDRLAERPPEQRDE